MINQPIFCSWRIWRYLKPMTRKATILRDHSSSHLIEPFPLDWSFFASFFECKVVHWIRQSVLKEQYYPPSLLSSSNLIHLSLRKLMSGYWKDICIYFSVVGWQNLTTRRWECGGMLGCTFVSQHFQWKKSSCLGCQIGGSFLHYDVSFKLRINIK